jgi:hypothetical protein
VRPVVALLQGDALRQKLTANCGENQMKCITLLRRGSKSLAIILTVGTTGCTDNPVAPPTNSEPMALHEPPREAVIVLAPLVWEAIAAALTVWSAKSFIDDCAPGITSDLYFKTVSESTIDRCLVGGATAISGEAVSKKLIVSGDVSKLKGAVKKALGSSVSSKKINSIFGKASRPSIREVKRALTSMFFENLVQKMRIEIWKFRP